MNKSVLLIDDEVLAREAIRILGNWSEFKVKLIDEASCVKDALEMIKKRNYSLIITDMNMPQLDGTYFLKALKQEHCTSKIIAISAYKDFNYLKTAIVSNVVDYLLKPIDPVELNEVLKDVFYTLEEEQIDAGDLKDEVYEDGEDICMKIIEYLKNNYKENIKLKDIADYVFLTREHICRIFKQRMEVTLFQYLAKIRLEEAKKLLTSTSCSIDEIANIVGLNSGNYLSRKFKLMYGMNPSEYRYR